jgi:crotonobetaine/carnitine-CoA ligase
MGAIEVPINNNNRGKFLQHVINNSDSQTLVIDSHYLDRLADISQNIPVLKSIFIRGEIRSELSFLGRFDKIMFESLYTFSDENPGILVGPNDVWSIMYTSGTTGPAKGVVLTHNYAFEFTMTLIKYMKTTRDDIQYCCWPMYNLTGQCETSMRAFLSDGKLALTPRFSASRFWDDARRYGCTEFVYFGGVIAILWKLPPKEEDANNPIRAGFGGPTPKEIHREFERRFNLNLVEIYGSTEAGFPLFNPYEERRVGSCGLPTDGYDVIIVDEEDNILSPNQTGELLVRPKRPHAIFEEYYKMPEATIKAFRNLWFHTGDMAYQNEGGYFYFVGRKKDSIRRRGQNISSSELEEVINMHPSVLESSAIGVPSELGEEDVMVFIVLKDRRTLDYIDFIKFCEKKMPYFMIPRYIEVVEHLPKTGTDRVEKYKLKERGLSEKTWDREKIKYNLER